MTSKPDKAAQYRLRDNYDLLSAIDQHSPDKEPFLRDGKRLMRSAAAVMGPSWNCQARSNRAGILVSGEVYATYWQDDTGICLHTILSAFQIPGHDTRPDGMHLIVQVKSADRDSDWHKGVPDHGRFISGNIYIDPSLTAGEIAAHLIRIHTPYLRQPTAVNTIRVGGITFNAR